MLPPGELPPSSVVAGIQPQAILVRPQVARSEAFFLYTTILVPKMLPPNYQIRLVEPSHYEAIIEICKLVYPTETPYTIEELEDHRQVFPQGQFVAVDRHREEVAGIHFTLRLRMFDFHIDDSWDILTAGGSFLDHNPDGPTLYGADIMVHPEHQHHGSVHALTDQTRFLVQEESLWCMVALAVCRATQSTV